VTTLAWVVGSGGLLGSHVARAVQAAGGFVPWNPPADPLPWEDRARLEARLGAAVRAFVAAAGHGPYGGWCLFWCAGAGVVGTSPATLDAESATWELFLARLGQELGAAPGARNQPGRLFLASSAGGLYAGSPERPLHEGSAPRPISPYGRAKLRQEQALERWAAGHPRVSSLVARISNLYGPGGRRMGRPKGLIPQMSRCLIHHQPVHIYVPLDTIRDYVYVEDAAPSLVRWMERLGAEATASSGARHVLKICASEQETTIATLLGVFRRLAKRQLKVVSGLHPLHAQQPARLQFRSRVWSDEPRPAATGLAVGVDRVYRHQLRLFQAGALPPPSLPRFTADQGPPELSAEGGAPLDHRARAAEPRTS
jgi:UDP-glucose 4-epimerase